MRTWFITGVSSGFGRAIADAVMAAEDRAVGTVRDEDAKARFESLLPGRSIGVLLDVRDETAVHETVDQVIERVGPIDVLVNNAGYGLEGAVEEVSLDEVRAQFDVNVFGALAVTQAVLPGMRARRRGHIVNITSMGGLAALPGFGGYHGSKFALEGISEALAKEVGPLGIRVTIVEPGAFRTEWAGRSLAHAARRISDYDTTAGVTRERMREISGKQEGDPYKAAAAIMAVVNAPDPPLHLLLGADALAIVGDKLGRLQAEMLRWARLSSNTSFNGESVRLR
jgi:NAD(P)-dependent dehydrogenase (short-subunit alcohol dehydrogenase family)